MRLCWSGLIAVLLSSAPAAGFRRDVHNTSGVAAAGQKRIGRDRPAVGSRHSAAGLFDPPGAASAGNLFAVGMESMAKSNWERR